MATSDLVTCQGRVLVRRDRVLYRSKSPASLAARLSSMFSSVSLKGIPLLDLGRSPMHSSAAFRASRLKEKLAFIPDRPKDKKFSDPAEFVRNVMGSSAGAGSGEFHVYRHIRRREYARQEFLQNCKEKDDLDVQYHVRLEENKRAVEEKAAKKRAKRQRQKERQKAKRQKNSKKFNKPPESSPSESSEEEEEEEHKEAGKRENETIETTKETQPPEVTPCDEQVPVDSETKRTSGHDTDVTQCKGVATN